jgi:hypothetical protein
MSTTTEPTGRLNSDLAAAVRTADHIDYWIRRHVIQYCCGTHPSQSKLNPARDRSIALSAIGQCLIRLYYGIGAAAPLNRAGYRRRYHVFTSAISESVRPYSENTSLSNRANWAR